MTLTFDLLTSIGSSLCLTAPAKDAFVLQEKGFYMYTMFPNCWKRFRFQYCPREPVCNKSQTSLSLVKFGHNPVTAVTSNTHNSLAWHLQHAHNCNPCPSPHTRLPPAPLARRCHVQRDRLTRGISRPDAPWQYGLACSDAGKGSTWLSNFKQVS